MNLFFPTFNVFVFEQRANKTVTAIYVCFSFLDINAQMMVLNQNPKQ